jgi:hypothetical protein
MITPRMSICKDGYARLLVRPELHHRIRILSAQTKRSGVELMDELLAAALDKVERELARQAERDGRPK